MRKFSGRGRSGVWHFSLSPAGIKKQSIKKGFTLVELIVYTGLVALLIFFLSGFVLNVLRVEGLTSVKRQTTEVAKTVLGDISLEARRGEKLYVATSIFSSSAGQLSIETKSDLGPEETVGFIDYYLSGGLLYKKKEGEEPFLLSGSDVTISEFRIERFGVGGTGDGVKIFLTISGGSGKYGDTVSVEKSFRFRKN